MAQHDTHVVIFISGLVPPAERRKADARGEDQEAVEVHTALQAVLRTAAALVSDGIAEVHLVHLPLLEALWKHQAFGERGASDAEGVGAASERGDAWWGACYVHAYSCLPELTSEGLDLADNIGCQLLERAKGFDVVRPSLEIGLSDAMLKRATFEVFLLHRSKTFLLFPSFTRLFVSFQVWQSRTSLPILTWPPNATCTIRVDDIGADGRLLPAASQSLPERIMRYLSWQELIQSDGMCKEIGDEELHALILVDCTLQIALPVTFFRLGHQRITWTVSVPITSHDPRLRLLEGRVGSRRWAEVSAQADAEGVGFSQVRVVDCFMFNNELDMLELRLLNHDQFADWMVIVESPTTHSGYSKPLVFQQARDQQRFSRFADKIVHRVVELPFEDPQQNEQHARTECRRVVPLLNLTNDDLMLIGDLDEIVDGSKFVEHLAEPLFLSKTSGPNANKYQPWCLSMSLHYYNWMCRAVGAAEVWQRSVLYRVEYLLHPLTVQARVPQLTGQDAPLEASYSSANDSLPSGCLPGFQYTEKLVGWHASYFFNRSGIENKLRSFWHANEADTVNVLRHQEAWDLAIARCEDLFSAVAGSHRQGFQMVATPLESQHLPIGHTLVGYYPNATDSQQILEHAASLEHNASTPSPQPPGNERGRSSEAGGPESETARENTSQKIQAFVAADWQPPSSIPRRMPVGEQTSALIQRIVLSDTLVDWVQVRRVLADAEWFQRDGDFDMEDEETAEGEIVYKCLSEAEVVLWDNDAMKQANVHARDMRVVGSLDVQTVRHTQSIELAIGEACECYPDPFHCHIGVAVAHRRDMIGGISRWLRHVQLNPDMFIDEPADCALAHCLLVPVGVPRELSVRLEADTDTRVLRISGSHISAAADVVFFRARDQHAALRQVSVFCAWILSTVHACGCSRTAIAFRVARCTFEDRIHSAYAA
jgi:hypothetical protein